MPEGWERRALCRSDPDLWWTETLSGQANHKCLVHCPVMQECRELAMEIRPFGCVMGGLVWVSSRKGAAEGTPGLHRSRPKACDICRGMAKHPCGYCGDNVDDYDRNKYGGPVHPECENDYRKTVTEIKSFYDNVLTPFDT